MDVESSDAIDNVKLCSRTRVEFQLTSSDCFVEEELKDGRTLADYNIQKDSTLHLAA